jgi:thiol:disulfide interchange protein
MIDFTADWCFNCKVNYKVAINTEKTSRMVAELNAVPMLADWSDHNEEIGKKLQELQSNSIPFLAIYPGSNPANPIVLRDLVSQGDVLEALQQAGPSVASAGSSRPAVASAVTSGHDR